LRAAFAAEPECSTGYWTRLVPILSLCLLIGALFPGRSEACSCISRTIRQQYDEARVVFVGKLVRAVPHSTDECGDETLTFVVAEAFKGAEKGGKVVVTNGSTGRRRDGSLPSRGSEVCTAACPTYVEQGRDYLVFAEGTPLGFSCFGPTRTNFRSFKRDRAELRVIARR
jgi:hypothetical protein